MNRLETVAKVCQALVHTKSSRRIGEARALSCPWLCGRIGDDCKGQNCADVWETVVRDLPCQSYANVSEAVAMILPCQSRADVSGTVAYFFRAKALRYQANRLGG